MAEVVFILIILYAAYVIHNVVTCNQKNKTKEKATPASIIELKTASKIETKKEEKATIPKTAKPPRKAPKKKAISKQAKVKIPKGSVRNPESGEITKIATSYRMTKRWIKEALVTEGLLEKVYKVSEINATATKKIDNALEKLQSLDRYQ